MSLLLIAVLVMPALAWNSSGSEGAGVKRAGSDTEPNDDKDGANPIGDSEVIDGTLKLSPSNDTMDFFVLQNGVSFGKVVTANLYMTDFCESEYSRINFDVAIYRWVSNQMSPVAAIATVFRNETAVCLQNWLAGGVETMWIRVCCTGPDGGRYRLTVDVSYPPQYPGAPVTGYLDDSAGPLCAYFRAYIGYDRGTRVGLQCPAGAIFYLHIASFWPQSDRSIYQNGSQNAVSGCLQEACLVGLGDWYNITVKIPDSHSVHGGKGTFTLTMEDYGGPPDSDNCPENATRLRDDGQYRGYVASGVDTTDWWKVNMRPGVFINNILFNLELNHFVGFFNFSVLDRDLDVIFGGYTEIIDNSINLYCITVDYCGPVYLLVRAGEARTQPSYDGGWGWYSISVSLPNEPPRLNSSVPEIVLDEDTVDDSLVLSKYFWDPDGDHVNYSLEGKRYDSAPAVDRGTGRVTFSPVKDWWGQEIVGLLAQDDGPRQMSVSFNVSVTVRPVNDFPFVNSSFKNATMDEGTSWRTPDMGVVFSDVDDEFGNLTFGCAIVGSDTHPVGAQLPLRFDAASHEYVLGPKDMLFGNLTVRLNCTDGRPGTVAGVTLFNISIAHVDHAPSFAQNVTDPLDIAVMEHETDHRLDVTELFADADTAWDYANDSLAYSVAGMEKLEACISAEGVLFIDCSRFSCEPGYPGRETIQLTARDAAGLSAVLNISVTVVPENDPPVISAFQPAGKNMTVKEMQKRTFSVTVLDPDTDISAMEFEWFLDGVRIAAARESTLAFQPDYSMGGADHKIRVDVTDDNHTVSKEWLVPVLDVDRLPEGAIIAPINFTKFAKGAMITFMANASDADGDRLSFTWRDGNGGVIGEGPTFSYNKFQKGYHTVRLEINDTKGSTFCEVTITIVEQGQKKTGGFEAGCLLAGVFTALVIIEMGKKRPRP